LFNSAMAKTLSLGGDTGTNCAIVAGLVGAYLGMAKLPDTKVNSVMKCDLSKGELPNRVAKLQPSTGDTLNKILKLIKLAPNDLQVEHQVKGKDALIEKEYEWF